MLKNLQENDEEDEVDDEHCFLKNKIIDGNYRETQNLNKREIIFFDKEKRCFHEGNYKGKKGHYEKIEKKVKEYLWLPDDKPSGLPNSLVVPEHEVPSRELKDLEKLHKNKKNIIRNVNYLGSETRIESD